MNAPTVQPSRLVLVGDPVAHSLSPVFQNAALRAKGLRCRYELLETPATNLADVIEGLRRENAAGNVTVPHKESFAAFCDESSPVARRVGAVNTFWFADGRLIGDNTDVHGVMAALKWLGCDSVHDRRCLVFGSGGSAAAVLTALADARASSITITARNRERAAALVVRLNVDANIVDSSPQSLESFDVVVNTTPVGLGSDEMPLDVERLSRNAKLLDLVYRKGGTALVRAARAIGIDADDGLRMLVEQGACSFERWFGVAPDRAMMWDSLAEYR